MGSLSFIFIRRLSARYRNITLVSKPSMTDFSSSVDIGGMRTAYESSIDEETPECKEPFGLFKKWLDTACQTPSIKEPNAMAVATASKSGQPSCRYVLLKQFDKTGFVFFTDRTSRKGRELDENPRASCLFYWDVLHRQVRIEGTVEKVSESESVKYFHSRPRASQLAAMVSHQSTIISSRKELIDKYAELETKFAEESEEIPKPERWGGYLVKPERIEFWQGHTNRLHHRVVFRPQQKNEEPDGKLTHQGEDGWIYEFKSP